MNFLASPMLVVAYSIIGMINVDINTTPLGRDQNGKDIYLKDIWPSNNEINDVINKVIDGDMFNDSYASLFDGDNNWKSILHLIQIILIGMINQHIFSHHHFLEKKKKIKTFYRQ